jgi:hypothetical protein
VLRGGEGMDYPGRWCWQRSGMNGDEGDDCALSATPAMTRLFGDSGQSGGGNDTLLGGERRMTFLNGGKDSDCLIGDAGNDDADRRRRMVTTFVFGYNLDANGDGDCDDYGEDVNVVGDLGDDT